MHAAAALTIRLLPTRLAGVLEGRAADCRGDAHLGRRETRPQAASGWGAGMMRAEWYLTMRLCGDSIPLPPRGHETAVGKPARILGRCWPAAVMAVSGGSARASRLTFCTPGWVGSGMAGYLGWLTTGQLWTGSPVSAYWR
jgi:hypothetical protein